jgi:hypothetical protein
MFAYVNKPSYRKNYVTKPKKGMYVIAKELNIPVTPIYIDYVKSNCYTISPQNIHIIVGDTEYVENVTTSVYNTLQFYKRSLEYCDQHKLNFD